VLENRFIAPKILVKRRELCYNNNNVGSGAKTAVEKRKKTIFYALPIKTRRRYILNRRAKIILAAIAVIVIAILAYVGYNSIFVGSKEVSFNEFIEMVDNSKPVEEVIPSGGEGGNSAVLTANTETGGVKFVKIAISSYKVYGYQGVEKKGEVVAESNYSYYSVGPNLYTAEAWETMVSEWASYGIEISYDDPNSGSIWSSLASLISIVLMCVLFWFVMTQAMGGGKGAMSFGKTKAKITTNIKVRFSDVAGAEEEKLELQEITEFLKSPGKFSDLGARIPKGVLLVGPPGTGKTLFAKAVAGEAGVPFFSVSGSDFVEMYVGVGASRVRDLFDIAKRNQPCIIFIDEIDAVGRERGAGLGGGSDEREQTLNQILVQMDGFEANESIIVMAATNRSDILDPALMRPGRFDRKIMVNLPDVKGREAILKVHSRNKPLATNVNFKTIARITSGFSGADLENLLNEAAILAARAGKKLIGNVELYEGVNKVLMGPQKKSHVVTESDKRCTAYHESGHAIIAQVCKYTDPVQEVSIIPRGNAAGYTMTRPDSDDQDMSKNKLIDMLCMILGGRAAEEIVIKDVTTGASNDLQKVSSIARRMVVEWGMSDKLGLISYGEAKPVFVGREIAGAQEYSEATAGVIDEEVHALINAAHERALKILNENRAVLDNMAKLLVERETIYNEEVCMLMKGASVEEVLAFMDSRDSTTTDNPFARYESMFKNGDGKGGKGKGKADDSTTTDTTTDPTASATAEENATNKNTENMGETENTEKTSESDKSDLS
jgi:cell division protease FtsH